jgi:hypothetical protein
MTTRINPTTGQLEAFIDDLNGYVAMMVPALVRGGYTVKLTNQQIALIEAIAESVQALQQSVQADGALLQSNAAILQSIQLLRQQDLGGISEKLDLLGGIEEIGQGLTALGAKIDAVVEAIEANPGGGNQPLYGTQTIQTVTLTNPNIQYTVTIPAGTVRYAFTCRDDETKGDAVGDVRFAWVANKVAPATGGLGVDDYEVLKPTQEESADQYFDTETTLYLASETPGVVVSFRSWDNASN